MPRGSQVLLEYHDHIELDDREYQIVNSSRSYIKALKIIRSKEIFEEDKVEAVLPLLFIEPPHKPIEAVYAYFDLFTDKRKSVRGREPAFDIVQDADYIYAGFMQTYGIDIDEIDMPIEKFIALLKGLPTNTKLAEIIKIREMPVPEPTKFNAKQRADIIEAKAVFALESDNIAKGWQSFGRMIKEWAEHGR
jgi:hypothetical protein